MDSLNNYNLVNQVLFCIPVHKERHIELVFAPGNREDSYHFLKDATKLKIQKGTLLS